MTDAFIYDAIRTPRGRGKADGALHEVTALNLASQALGAIKERNKLDPKAATSPASPPSWRATATRCRACRSTASAPRVSMR
jgi:acetyl-CoA acetyltransferase